MQSTHQHNHESAGSKLGAADQGSANAVPQTVPVGGALLGDGIFELALGCCLILVSLTGFYSRMRLPPPASRPLVIALGVLLLPVGLWLIAAARRWTREVVIGVAIGNVSFALMLAVWLGAAWGRFAAAGRVLALVVAGVLVVLGIAEMIAVAGQPASKTRVRAGLGAS